MEVHNCPRCGDGAPYICQKCYDELYEENKRLREENEQLKSTLREIISGVEGLREKEWDNPNRSFVEIPAYKTDILTALMLLNDEPWYCPNCDKNLPGTHVTYEETCVLCGSEVE